MMVAELKQRRVFKVATAYMVVGWIVLHLVGIIFERFAAPTWAMQFFSVLIALGFPVACGLTCWMKMYFQQTSVKEHQPVWRSPTIQYPISGGEGAT